jgi:hypothetical protein
MSLKNMDFALMKMLLLPYLYRVRAVLTPVF